jgi:hypothetical protein
MLPHSTKKPLNEGKNDEQRPQAHHSPIDKLGLTRGTKIEINNKNKEESRAC